MLLKRFFRSIVIAALSVGTFLTNSYAHTNGNGYDQQSLILQHASNVDAGDIVQYHYSHSSHSSHYSHSSHSSHSSHYSSYY
jgi:hypothetical protein